MTAQNKCVFSFCQNTINDEVDVIPSGRLCHSFGPAEANDCDREFLGNCVQ